MCGWEGRWKRVTWLALAMNSSKREILITKGITSDFKLLLQPWKLILYILHEYLAFETLNIFMMEILIKEETN